MTVRDSQRAITPGSLEQGGRAELEQGLSQVLSQAEQQQGPTPEGGPAPLVIPEDPMGALLDGGVEGNPELPTTDGLSVGPGQGPNAAPDIMMGDRASRIRQIAAEATSPSIRAGARNELRRMAREGI